MLPGDLRMSKVSKDSNISNIIVSSREITFFGILDLTLDKIQCFEEGALICSLYSSDIPARCRLDDFISDSLNILADGDYFIVPDFNGFISGSYQFYSPIKS